MHPHLNRLRVDNHGLEQRVLLRVQLLAHRAQRCSQAGATAGDVWHLAQGSFCHHACGPERIESGVDQLVECAVQDGLGNLAAGLVIIVSPWDSPL